MQSTKSRRKITPITNTTTAINNNKAIINSNGAAAADSEKLDELLLFSAICNGEDLASFVRKAFISESEIEEVCKIHYQDFITAVDELKSLLSDVDKLKSSLSVSNNQLHSVASPLLDSLDSFIESKNVSKNVSLAIESVQICIKLLENCGRTNSHLLSNNYYMVLKCVDNIERDYLGKIDSSTIRCMLERQIPLIRGYIEKRVNKEFGDWLVEIRIVSRNLGQLAIGQASSARQREEELRIKQRQAEEQSRLSLRDCVYALEEEDDDEDVGGNVGDDSGSDKLVSNGGGAGGVLGFDLTPLYRAYHIHQTLGLEERFKHYYFENRKLQLTSDFQVSSMTPFLESHQTFFAQIAGFFIVEDRVLRTGGGLISKYEVENLWETAVMKMCSVLEDQFSRMQTANHLLLIKDYVSLLGVTLRRYGYLVDPLLDVLSKHRDKYHELLLSDCRKLIGEAVSADGFEQMLMKKEYEYSMNVLSFQIQTSDITPAFPYIAPFSSRCQTVAVFFMSYGGQLDFHDVVKKYLDRLLGEVLDEALLNIVKSNVHGVSQAMQVAANMVVLERACDFFFRHAAQLSGIPLRITEIKKSKFPLTSSVMQLNQCFQVFSKLSDYISQTLVSTAQQILPVQVLQRVLQEVLSHISEKILGILAGDLVKRFSINAVMGIDVDIQLLESFAENQSTLFTDVESNQLKSALAESRQMINLLLSNQAENFLNPVIRERSYKALDYRKVVTIAEKLKDPSDRYFGSFAGRGAKVNTKKKSLDALIKRLKEAH
ncbi:hypothetical protein MKW92_023914 [Papaver armeniacum]|nr:hypothetical protein MKW92_023914 [Papaver armeniacum]